MTSVDNLYRGKNDDEPDTNLQKVCYLNKGEEDEMEIYGYKRCVSRYAITWACILSTFGLLRLVFHWCEEWLLYSTHRRCPLKYADSVLVIYKYQGSHTIHYVEKVKRLYLNKLSLEDVAAVYNEANTNNPIAFSNQTESSVKIFFSDGSFIEESDLIIIKIKELIYVWHHEKEKFSKLSGIEKGLRKSDMHNMSGYCWQEQLLRRMVHGTNEIVVKVDSYARLIILEVLTPFYIFQIISLILWFVELYLYYSFAIIAMSLFGIILTVIQLRENQLNLFKTVQVQSKVTVCRDTGKSKRDTVYEEIPISYLVPGDVIVIPRSGFTVPCDAVLLSGNCIVNESMLTGESVPLTKTPLPCINSPYNEREDSNHTLYCGTQVLQARYYANEDIQAVVLRTGFLTAKGGLIRSILHPVPHDFKFDQDCYKFIFGLALVAIAGTAYAVWAKMKVGADLFETIVDSLDIITIVVPPALPAAMSVGKYYAQSRLLKQKISCINSSVINVSGSLNCICFDKTGTLTDDGLDLYGVIPVEDHKLVDLKPNLRNSDFSNLKEAMASCHSLTLINGVTSGDPLDVKMFESTGWVLDESEFSDTIKYDLLAPTIVKSSLDDEEIGIIHQFQFSSHLQRMSVITRHLDSPNLTVYCKGSPEMITSLSIPESVPQNLHAVLEKQTDKGYRVIAIGYKTTPPIDILKMKKLHRNEVECNLIFAGLVIFENKLKPQTTPVISDLKKAKMKIVMLTGDNIRTAICVAKECGIIEPKEVLFIVNTSSYNGHSGIQLTFTPDLVDAPQRFYSKPEALTFTDVEVGSQCENNYKYAMTGQTWEMIRDHRASHIQQILQNAIIFARMSSDQKQQVIQELQAMCYYVGMCGDGANDCGALKTADVGISLSEAEASVASAFTSKHPDISCVPKVIKEGRAALVTAFGLFKYMVLYSLVQFFSTILLFTFASQLTDFQFLFIDGFLIVISAFFFGQTKPYSGPLVAVAPTASLISPIPLLSILTQFILMVIFQIFSAYLVRHFPWYSPATMLDQHLASYDNYAVYILSQFQYITLAVTYSFGKPYREAIFKNTPFFVSLICLTLISLYISICPINFVQTVFELRLPPINFRIMIVSLAVINFTLSVCIETFALNYLLKKIDLSKKENKSYAKGDQKKSELFWKMSVEHLSEIEVRSYGTMKL